MKSRSYLRQRTLKAMSTFSFGMLVQVKCIQVSMPIKPWHVLTISDVRSDVRPPAFLCTFVVGVNS